ncbi:MAG: DUF22 domain-containing protein [Archaeoglobaceae archaeon]
MMEVGFKTGRYAYWKILIAREDVELTKGSAFRIPVEKIRLPPKTMISPLSIMRHALGTVVDVRMEKKRKIEEEKEIDSAIFLSISDGIVKRGEVVGIVKVYPTAVREGEAEAKVELKKSNATVVYRKGKELRRVSAKVEDGWYRRWHLAKWFPLVADENIDVEAGTLERVKVKGVEIPENTIPVPMMITRNAMGNVVDVISPGRPRKVEERRFVSEVIFVSVVDGEIKKGDLLGVLNVYYVAVGEFTPSLMSYLTRVEEANIVYRKNREFRRKKVKLSLLTFKRSEFGFFKSVISAEDKELKKGEIGLLKVEKLELPSSTIVQPIAGVGADNCSLIGLYSEIPKLVEEDKTINEAMICSFGDTSIKKGDIVGALAVYNIAILVEPELFLAKYATRL